jgi:hypothetical protein
VNLVSSATVADDALALVYLDRVLEDRAQLVSAVTDDWRIKPPLPNRAFNVPVTDSTALIEADAPSKTLRDLAAFQGQLEITYDGWRSSDQRIKLTPTDRRRVCRTIVFADRVQKDLHSLPGSSPTKFDASPPGGCKTWRR